jgi:hypothetical protein
MAQFLANILSAIAKGDAEKMVKKLEKMRAHLFESADLTPIEDHLVRWWIVPASFYAPNAKPLTELIRFYGSKKVHILDVHDVQDHLGATIGQWSLQDIVPIVESLENISDSDRKIIMDDVRNADCLAHHPRDIFASLEAALDSEQRVQFLSRMLVGDPTCGPTFGPIEIRTMIRIATDAELHILFQKLRDVPFYRAEKVAMQEKCAREMGRRNIGLSLLLNDREINRVDDDDCAPIHVCAIIAAINGAANGMEPSVWFAPDAIAYVDAIADASHAKLLRALSQPKYRAKVVMTTRIAQYMWMPLLLTSATREIMASELQIVAPRKSELRPTYSSKYSPTSQTLFFGTLIPADIVMEVLKFAERFPNGADAIKLVMRGFDTSAFIA